MTGNFAAKYKRKTQWWWNNN